MGEIVEEYRNIIDVVLVVLVLAGAVLAGRKPLHRGAYVGRFLLTLFTTLALSSLLIYAFRDSPHAWRIPAFLELIELIGIAVITYFSARRLVDLGWSRWWYLSACTVIGWMILVFVPMFVSKKEPTEEKAQDPVPTPQEEKPHNLES